MEHCMLIPKRKQATETIIIVGPYRIPVTREAFKKWEAELMGGAGFTDREIKAEILRRLGYEQN